MPGRADPLRGVLGQLRGVFDAVDQVLDAVDQIDLSELDVDAILSGWEAGASAGGAAAARREAAETLGLDPDGEWTEAEVRAAYRAAARRAHPDLGGSSAAFRRVAQARDVLLGEA